MLTTKTTATKTEDTALVLLESSASTALPTAIKRLLPSISSLVDEDVVHRREMFLEIAERVEAAASELELMNVRAAPAEVIKFMTMFAERRGFNLPEPALLVMDAHSVAEIIPADLFKRTWSETPAWFRTKLSVASDASIALSFSDVSDAHQFFTSPLRSSNNLDDRANPPHGRNTDIGCR